MDYCVGLENRSPRKGAGGSNPSLSALIINYLKDVCCIMEFKKFDGVKVDLVPYVEGYCREHDNIFVMVSTDSQSHTRSIYSSLHAGRFCSV